MIIINESIKEKVTICNSWWFQEMMTIADQITDIDERNEFLLSIRVSEEGEPMQNLFLEVPD